MSPKRRVGSISCASCERSRGRATNKEPKMRDREKEVHKVDDEKKESGGDLFLYIYIINSSTAVWTEETAAVVG